MTNTTLRNQARNAPLQFNLEQFYSQLYNQLAGQNYENSLLGSEGGEQTFNWTGQKGRQRSATLKTPGTRGLLDIYEKEIAPAMQRTATSNRTADINDVATLGPKMREALRASSPEIATLLDKLYGSATSDLELGASLNPSESRNISNAVRSGQAARGMGLGPNDNFNEALTSLNYGRGLQEQRRGNASQAVGLLESFYGDPQGRVLGTGTGTGNATAAFFGGTGAGRGMSRTGLFNPSDPLAYNIHAFNANATNQDKAMGQEQWAHMMDQIKASLENIGGMFAGGMGGSSGGNTWSSGTQAGQAGWGGEGSGVGPYG